ncbi:hypothetical protein HanIR_Chr10g0462151 [Helianthus annuus]|nr:hypothetical protein HanIR_Chr10g0462151 [Helianthus annuus]
MNLVRQRMIMVVKMRQEFESLEFAIVKAAGKLSRKPNGIALLKIALGDEDPEGGDAGPSR